MSATIGQGPALAPHQSSERRTGEQPTDNARRIGRVAYTLTACCRCRDRKTGCDPKLPRCSHCEKRNAICEYFDAAKGRRMPRSYVVQLQEKARQLEAELKAMDTNGEAELDVEGLVKEAGLVKMRENDEPRFLGPASGIAMTRLVMELAKELSNAQTIREVVSESKAQGIKNIFREEQSKPTSKVYPLISFVAAPHLPTQDLTDKLVDNFNLTAQIHYPVLHIPSFRQVVKDVYRGSTDDCKNFMLRMVIALSMHKLDTQYAGLADSYYLAALPYLENAIRPMNLETLQCFALIAEYSMTTPTRTAAYWVVGLAIGLLQDLRMTDEATIGLDKFEKPLDAIQVDLRRRLFWVMATLELGLAHSLGRPSALAFTHDHLDVKPFLEVDDDYITAEGVLPGSPPSFEKQLAVHFMKMRYLQLEVRRALYLKKRVALKNNADPWFDEMERKINHWMHTYPRHRDKTDIAEKWFKIRYNTMIVFLFRPSPQVPHPSVRAARLCFEAVRENIYFQKEQIDSKSADTTWIFTQQLFMATNTMLWAISYAEVREEHPKVKFEEDLRVALEAIWWASKKWPGAESALELYNLLTLACLKAYDGDSHVSYGVGSSQQHLRATTSTSFVSSSPTQPTGLAYDQASQAPYMARNTVADLPGGPFPPYGDQSVGELPQGNISFGHTDPSGQAHTPYNPMLVNYGFSPFQSPLPPAFSYSYDQGAQENLFAAMTQDRNLFAGPFEHQLGDFQGVAQPMDGLNQEQQSELMSNLELYGLDGAPVQAHPNVDENESLST